MRIGEWQIAETTGESRFLFYQIGEDHLQHYKGSLAHEDEVQNFVRDRQLTLVETVPLIPGPMRRYRRLDGQADRQAVIFEEVERYRRSRTAEDQRGETSRLFAEGQRLLDHLIARCTPAELSEIPSISEQPRKKVEDDHKGSPRQLVIDLYRAHQNYTDMTAGLRRLVDQGFKQWQEDLDMLSRSHIRLLSELRARICEQKNR